MKQCMVHSFETESVVCRGTEKECLAYINIHSDQELELYWADEKDRHYIEAPFELAIVDEYRDIRHWCIDMCEDDVIAILKKNIGWTIKAMLV